MSLPLPDPWMESNHLLRSQPAVERIRWAASRFGDGLVLLASMQKTSAVLMHMFSELGLSNEVLFLDTGYHFADTLRMRDAYARRYRLNLVTLYPELTVEEQETQYGKKLWTCADGQPECCRLRKEAPLLAHLAGRAAPVVANGLRREEGGARAQLPPLTPDPRTGGLQLSPLFDWTSTEVAAYVASHDLPIHPLHARGYPSIGCAPCTTPVAPGEDPRAGRWRHLRVADEDAPKYCNVNFTDGAGI